MTLKESLAPLEWAADKGILVPQSSGLKKKGWRMIIMPIPFPSPFNVQSLYYFMISYRTNFQLHKRCVKPPQLIAEGATNPQGFRLRQIRSTIVSAVFSAQSSMIVDLTFEMVRSKDSCRPLSRHCRVQSPNCLGHQSRQKNARGDPHGKCYVAHCKDA